MSAIEKWSRDFADSLAQDDITASRTVETTLEMRIAVGLVQARALECRQLAGTLQVQGLTRNPMFQQMWARLIDRSSDLEKLAVEIGQNWNAVEQPKIEVVQ